MSKSRTSKKSTRRGVSKTSRAAFKAWDTRRANEAAERRSKAARKAVATRRRNAQ